MLQDQTILVTGASKGIGAAIVKHALANGADIYANMRNADDWEALLKAIPPEYHVNVHLLEYDITDEQAVKKAFGEIQKQKPLTGLVNNAGIMLDAALGMTRLADVEQQFNVNTKAAYQHCQLASRLMSRNKQGSIVNLNSQVATQGSAGQSAYAMSKAAISGLTKSIAKELGPLNIRVNEVCPGFITTDLTQGYTDKRRQQIIENTSLRRLGTAEDVARTVVFLLSENASFITGQSIAVDGQISL